jgi:hypothetical protein
MILNILVGFFIIGINVVIQGYGNVFWMAHLKKYRTGFSQKELRRKGPGLLIKTSFMLLSIHLFQTTLWALVYLLHPAISEFETFEKSLYFSLVTFTTLGYGDITIGPGQRILAGLEAINGITLIGWSTAFMFAVFLEMMKIRFSEKNTD